MSRRAEVEVLLVEDDPAHVALTLAAVKRANEAEEGGRHFSMEVARDGEEALARLRRPPPPDLILLDLRLPRRSGREVLEEIKRDPALVVIPVIVLTTSELEQDVLEAYKNHIAAYLVKPLRVQPLIEEMNRLKRFWTAESLRYPYEKS